MLKANISIGKTYVAKISGKLARVSITSVSAAKLRREFVKRNLAFEIASGLNTQAHGE